MDEQIQLALRNWQKTQDPQFAIEFTRLFLQAQLPVPEETYVWMVIYNHKHGQDISAYRTEKMASEAAAFIILEYLEDEIDDEELQQEIRESIEDGVIADAITAYQDGTDYRETINIEKSILYA